MSDFTPAPWHDHIDDDGELYVEMGDGHYAYFGDVENTCGTCHANARLTAAAPTMRDALQAALGILEDARTLDDAQNAIPFLRDAMHVADGDDE